MIATADSKTSSKIWAEIKKVNKEVDKEGPVFPNKVSRRCPAIILAASRTARVPGRITFLIVSINTMKGIRADGVPWGTKWANICWVWLIHPNSIKAIQRGRERDRVIVKWLELVKMYGRSPKKLLNTISLKSDTNIIVTLEFLAPKSVLNSRCKVVDNLNHKRDHRDGMAQNSKGIKIIPKKVDNQFKDKFMIEEVGSNTENRFVIIFNSFLF